MAARLRKDLWVLDVTVQPDALEQYRQACARLFDIDLLSPEDEFYNRLEGYNVGGLVFGRCQGPPQRMRRTLSHVAADSSETVMAVVDLQDSGWRADYDGRPASGEMGTIRLVDMSRPFDFSTGTYQTLNLMTPRAMLDPDTAGVDFHGRVVREDSPSGHLLGSHLRSLWSVVGEMTPTEALAAAKAITALLSGAILAHGEASSTGTRPVERMLLAQAQHFVAERLDDPDLTPEAVRQHLGVSRSLLYATFASAGGVSAFIQSRRLDRAFDRLLEDGEGQQTLAEISYRHGFRSDAHFSRAFRARFGMAPGRLRKVYAAAGQEGLSATERPDDVFAWLRSL